MLPAAALLPGFPGNGRGCPCRHHPHPPPGLPPLATCPPARAPGLSLWPPAGPRPHAGVKNLPAGFQEGGAGLPELTRRTPHRAPPPPRAPCPACTAPPAGRRCPSRTPGSGPAPTDPASACGPGSPTTTRSRNRWTVRPGRGAWGGVQGRPGKVRHRLCPHPAPGVFVYPLAEAEVVSGFEAEAAGRRVSFQLQSRRRSQAACCSALGPALGASTPRRCTQGESRALPAPSPESRRTVHRIPLQAPALHPTSPCPVPPTLVTAFSFIDSHFHSTIEGCAPDAHPVLVGCEPGLIQGLQPGGQTRQAVHKALPSGALAPGPGTGFWSSLSPSISHKKWHKGAQRVLGEEIEALPSARIPGSHFTLYLFVHSLDSCTWGLPSG